MTVSIVANTILNEILTFQRRRACQSTWALLSSQLTLGTFTRMAHADYASAFTLFNYLRGLLEQSNYADKTAYTDMPK